MNYAEIKKIIDDMENSKLAELAIEFPDGTKINIKNETKVNVRNAQVLHTDGAVYNDIPKEMLMVEDTKNEDDGLKVVTSPMVGTFYAKSSPSADPFAWVGKKVKKGETLCIIEAMKLMNEIESEFDGEIVEILAQNEEAVDYGKPLFKIK